MSSEASSSSQPDRSARSSSHPKGLRATATAIYGLAAVLAGVGAALLANQFASTFKIPEELAGLQATGATQEQFAQQVAALKEAAHYNTILNLGIVGAVTAAVLALGTGLAWGARRGAVTGAALGVPVGALFGAAGGCLGFLLNQKLLTADFESTIRAVLVHSAEWAIVGAAIGLAAGFAARHRAFLKHSVASCAFAGIVAGALFSPLAMVALPSEKPEYPLPQGLKLLLLFALLPSVLAAIGLARLHSRMKHE